MKFIISVFLILFSVTSFAQAKKKNPYVKYIDSSYAKIDDYPKIAQQYIDSIPQPVQENIKGHLAEYYEILALINGKNKEQVKIFQNYFLALKYAKQEKKYDIAGNANLELFYNVYLVKQDSTAFNYLIEAKKYYTLSNNKNGLVEVMQMPAYVEYNKGNYEKSNLLLLQHLEYYKSIKDDAYYYLYALFMITSNYIHLNNLDKAHFYFSQLKALRTNKTIPLSLHDLHLAPLYNCMAHTHLSQKAMDSTLMYLKMGDHIKTTLNHSDVRDHFEIYINYYEAQNNLEAKKNYIDSLRIFESSLLDKSVDASFQINHALLNSEAQLQKEIRKKQFNRYLIAALIIGLLALITLLIVRYKVIKRKISEFAKQNKEYTFLKSNHEKLKVKVHGLEDYLTEVKKEVKQISTIKDVKEQHLKIKELYKNIHYNSSNIITKGESHFELISELNIEFFNEISNKYPELSHSEIIICYYVFSGFKNKEIAAFLNTSDRAIESKRFRIRKKLNLKGQDISLLDQLEQVLPD
ncbi:hypothetical protein ACFQ0I_06645 [Mariniflexile aquimaris]|uniref:HTH luxR-type domain-containing protein n=1 Tax=Mariniflexile aquimaris TaxID=881009 RepID=A0ABW3BRD9_9FLAO